MDAFYFDDREFFQEQLAGDRSGKWPLNLAIGLHVAVFLGAVFLPGLIERKPLLLDNVITIDLVSMPEMEPEAPAAPAAPKISKLVVKDRLSEPAPVEKPPEPIIPAVSIAPEPDPEPEIAPEPVAVAEPVSLKPLKRKIKVAKDTRLVEERQRDLRAKAIKDEALADKKRADAKRNKALADAKKRKVREAARKAKALALAEQAERDAARAASAARQELASVIRENNTAPASSRASSGSGTGRKKTSSAVLNQYGARLNSRISSYWQVPEMVKSSNLKTKVLVTILKTGTVADMRVKRGSGNQFFDQSIMKALKDATPLPSFPALITESSLQFELNFTPQGLAL